MGLMGMNPQLRTTTYGGQINFFDSQERRFIRGGATIDSTKVSDKYKMVEANLTRLIVPAGMIYAPLANGKYAPVKSTALAVAADSGATSITVVDASNLQVGDSIIVGTANAVAISAVNYSTNVVTVPALSAAAAIGAQVQAADGGTAEFLSTEVAEVTLGDVAITGVDMARVLTQRLPYKPTTFIKAQIPMITFKG